MKMKHLQGCSPDFLGNDSGGGHLGERKAASVQMIDLSRLVADGMAVFPGHPPVKISSHLTSEKDGRNVEHISMGSHTGTHIDLPYHFIEDGATADNALLNVISGPAVLLDFSGKAQGCITVSDLEQNRGKIRSIKRLVLRTDWQGSGRHYYRDYPYLTLDAVKWLCDAKIEMLGVDTPSPGPCGDLGNEIHEQLLKHDIYIIEGLANLKQIEAGIFYFMCLPLYVKGTGGAPCRAVAIKRMSETSANEM